MGKNESRLTLAFYFFFLLFSPLFATDFDCVIIGSSPVSLFEALYQCHSGKRVLILEESDQCGGAWKGIDICGVRHADLGCHLIGNDMKLKSFLETYAGCKIVSIDNPLAPYETTKGPNGWYFSRGCYELIENLLTLIEKTDIVLLTSTRAEKVFIDSLQEEAIIETEKGVFTTKKVLATFMSQFILAPADYPQNYPKNKHYHLYLLVQDPTNPRFSYHGGVSNGVSRMMNLTHFTGLHEVGRQLIVIQTYAESWLNQAQFFFDALKTSSLLDPEALLITSQTYIYETGSLPQSLLEKIDEKEIVEVLQTSVLGPSLSRYIPKWETVLKPYWNILTNQE